VCRPNAFCVKDKFCLIDSVLNEQDRLVVVLFGAGVASASPRSWRTTSRHETCQALIPSSELERNLHSQCDVRISPLAGSNRDLKADMGRRARPRSARPISRAINFEFIFRTPASGPAEGVENPEKVEIAKN